MTKVSASILGADPLNLENDIRRARDADFLHFDVMDGHFVPNLSFGPKTYLRIKRRFKDTRVELHLMTADVGKYLELFPSPYVFIFHPSSICNIKKTISLIQSANVKVGIALNQDESFDNIKTYLDKLDLILVMGVLAGFGGQDFIPDSIAKIKEVRSQFTGQIEVDGGVTRENARTIVDAGADILVSGSWLFEADTSLRINKLKKI